PPARPRDLRLRSIASFFFSSRRRHTRCLSDWSSDVCSSDLCVADDPENVFIALTAKRCNPDIEIVARATSDEGEKNLKEAAQVRSEEHTSELQSLRHLVCRLLLEKKKNQKNKIHNQENDKKE